MMPFDEYARAVIDSALMGLHSPAEAERRVEVRLRRQQLLTADDEPLRLWVVLAEPALHCIVGSAAVMRVQYKKLVELADLPNVTLQVLPTAKGVHSALMTGSFDVLKFASPHEPDVVYTESATRNRYVEDDVEVHVHTLVFDHIRATALGTAESRAYLEYAAEQL